MHPRRVLHGLAAPPDWRGEIRVRRQTQSPDPAEMPVKRHSIKRAHSTFEDGKRKEREKQLRTQKTSHPQREAHQNIIPYQLLYHLPKLGNEIKMVMPNAKSYKRKMGRGLPFKYTQRLYPTRAYRPYMPRGLHTILALHKSTPFLVYSTSSRVLCSVP